MDSLVLEPKKQELEDFIQGNPDAREVKRALAVKWSLSGIPYRQIRKLLNVSLGFISKWNKNFSTRGVNGLKIAYKGKPSYLSQSDKEEIILWLSHKEMWDLAELAIHIESKYDVIYQSQESYYSLLKSAKISWKKSQKKNPQGSSKLVSEKKTEINQYLETWKSDREKGKLCVFMLDECHLLWGDLCGYVWGKSARRVEVEMTNQKQRQTYYGA
jgi:putative transposase